MTNPFARIAELEETVSELSERLDQTHDIVMTLRDENRMSLRALEDRTKETLTTHMNALEAQGEMLGGLAERVQELEVPKQRTHFSGRAPEVKTR